MSLASDELAERIRNRIGDRPGIVEKKMFGGIAFMLGFVEVDGDVIEDDDTLADWIARAWTFVSAMPPK